MDQSDITSSHISTDGVHTNFYGATLVKMSILNCFHTFNPYLNDFEFDYDRSLFWSAFTGQYSSFQALRCDNDILDVGINTHELPISELPCDHVDNPAPITVEIEPDTAPFETILSPFNPSELSAYTKAGSPNSSSVDEITNHLGSEDDEELYLSGSYHTDSLPLLECTPLVVNDICTPNVTIWCIWYWSHWRLWAK